MLPRIVLKHHNEGVPISGNFAQHSSSNPSVCSVSIILLSSSVIKIDPKTLFEFGIKASLTKPYRQTDLLDTIYETLNLNRRKAKVDNPATLAAVEARYRTAIYLVHSMGRGNPGDFERRDKRAAENFARWARAAGVEQVIYLGGLGDRPRSAHLRSRLQVGQILSALGPPLTWFRAGRVDSKGAGRSCIDSDTSTDCNGEITQPYW